MSWREFRIWLRRSSREPRRPGPRAFAARSRVVLLVHGFNVSEREARAAYGPFADALEDAPEFVGNICSVHWPRDGPPGISGAFYPNSVQTARQCAADLKQYIEEMLDVHGRPSKLVVIAHSLGSRLAIEALTNLTPDPHREVRLIVMAAAYPVSLAAVNAAALFTLRPLVMYSPSDWVLRRTFPFGEWLGREAGPGWPEAVGLWGLPARGAWSSREQMHGFDHGAYWSRSAAVTAAIRAELGLPAPISVAARELVSVTPPEHAPGERDLPQR